MIRHLASWLSFGRSAGLRPDLMPAPLGIVATLLLIGACSQADSESSTSADLTASSLDCGNETTDWPMAGQNICNTHSAKGNSPINVESARKLAPKWVFSAKGEISATPAVVEGSLYVPD